MVYYGIELIRCVEEYAVSVLISFSFALFVWAVTAAGGVGLIFDVLSVFVVGGV